MEATPQAAFDCCMESPRPEASRRRLFANNDEYPDSPRGKSWCSVGCDHDTVLSTPATPTAEAACAARQPSVSGSEGLDGPQLQLDQPAVDALAFWLENLVALQPKAVVDDAALDGAVVLVQALFARRPDLHATLRTSAPHLAAYGAAALWTSTKVVGVRTKSPNRSLMSQAAAMQPQALTDFELDLCCSLSWDMAALLRAADLLQ